MKRPEVFARGVAVALLLAGCGGDADAEPSEDALLDVHGTVGTHRVDLTEASVSFLQIGVDDALTSFESLDDERTLSVDLSGRFPVGRHVLGADYGDAWDSSIAAATINFYTADQGWGAGSSKHSERHSPITFDVSVSTDEELSGMLSATLLPREGTSGTVEARLQVRIHGFGPGQNVYGGSASPSGGGGGDGMCHSTVVFDDLFGAGRSCTQAPCSETAGSMFTYLRGECASADVKYGCCGAMGNIDVHVFTNCTTGRCGNYAGWSETCDQFGGVAREGACL